MIRICCAVLAGLAGAAPALAQPNPLVPRPPEIPLRILALQPAPAPVPALHYKLLPELRDTTPGNAVLLYYRAFSPEWWQNIRANKEVQQAVEKALEAPPAEARAIPELAFVRDWVVLKEVDRAARRSYCDWEMTQRVREEGAALLLPDVQSMREFMRYLAIRAKLELADGQLDKAARTLQTGLQMGRHVSDAPTLIQALVGAAITQVMLDRVEEWVRAPGSPNLYWALADLPQPFIDLRKPLQGEQILMDNLLPGFREALAGHNAVPLAPAQLDEIKVRFRSLVGERNDAALIVQVFKKYAPAKEYLRAQGWPAEQVEALPPMQAVLLSEVATYDRLFDEMMKYQGLPHWQARAGSERAEQLLKDEVVRSGAPALSLAGLLLPAINKVQFASARIDRRINMLRCVEAIRLYAAGHEGKLPGALADITEVPVPLDPVTGQPFEYHADDARATLTAPPPPHELPHEGNSLRYVITLKH